MLSKHDDCMRQNLTLDVALRKKTTHVEDREITDSLSDHGSGLHADRSNKKEGRTNATARMLHLYVVFVSETMVKTMVRSGCLRLLAAGLAAAVPDMNETNLRRTVRSTSPTCRSATRLI